MTWLQLAHKTAIVTGAGSGIGAAVTKVLAAAHCRVIMADTSLKGMEQVANEKEGGSAAVRIVECNVADAEQVQSLMKQADEFAAVDNNDNGNDASILVNCAGITRDKWITKMLDQDWDDVMNVNLKATFLTSRAFLQRPRLLRQPASIVNVGSVVSEFGNLGQVNYAASKGGVLGLTRALAKEVASQNVRVNAVLPGFIDTPMVAAVPDHVKERMVSKIPLQRFGSPDEVANVIAFLVSPRSSYITGECIRVSGMIAV